MEGKGKEKKMKYKIDNAISECRRFLSRANDWKKRIKTDKYALLSGSREGGAAKRASLDLSRALADLRKGNQ